VTRDYAADFRKFLERCGCKVTAEGTATIGPDGEPKLDMWAVELKGQAKRELATLVDWKLALLAMAGVDQAAE
jgi:hypothetical protein